MFYFVFYFSILFILVNYIAQFFKMPKVFFCSNCSLQHARPVGKRCQQMLSESFSSDADAPAPPLLVPYPPQFLTRS